MADRLRCRRAEDGQPALAACPGGTARGFGAIRQTSCSRPQPIHGGRPVTRAVAQGSAVAEILSWIGRPCAAKGWMYEVWSGVDTVVMRNVRFLSDGSPTVSGRRNGGCEAGRAPPARHYCRRGRGGRVDLDPETPVDGRTNRRKGYAHGTEGFLTCRLEVTEWKRVSLTTQPSRARVRRWLAVW